MGSKPDAGSGERATTVARCIAYAVLTRYNPLSDHVIKRVKCRASVACHTLDR